MNVSLRALGWLLSVAMTALPGALLATQTIDNSRLSGGSISALVAVCCVFAGLLTAASSKWHQSKRFEIRWLIHSLIYLPVTILISGSILFVWCVWDFVHSSPHGGHWL
jgi:ABC-type Mn2+/Zn2+ transport system permease subunit